MTVQSLTKRQSYLEGFQYQETIADGATGDDVIIPPLIAGKKISCRVICGAGTGKIQVTLSLDSAVVAGTAIWEDWESGNVTGTQSDVAKGPITGIRGVSISGEIVLEVII